MKNQHADKNTDQRVRQVPAGGKHDETGGNGANGPQSVAHHVQKGSPQVEVMMVRTEQDQAGNDIDDEPQYRNYQHTVTLNLWWMKEPVVRRGKDNPYD